MGSKRSNSSRVLYCWGKCEVNNTCNWEHKNKKRFFSSSFSFFNDESIHFCCFNNLTTIRIDESHLIRNQTNERTSVLMQKRVGTGSNARCSYQYELRAHSSPAPTILKCAAADVIVKWPDRQPFNGLYVARIEPDGTRCVHR